MPSSGSERTYWRLTGQNRSAIGAFHPVKEENTAFLALSEHFRKHRLNVPEIYFSSKDSSAYLMQDLGDMTLFSWLSAHRDASAGPDICRWFGKALKELVRFQVAAGRDLDYRVCYPRRAFDRQSLKWDLDYFKYDFLKVVTVFNEQKLEDDFQALADFLLQAPAHYFMYRDFQSRNIMIHQDNLYFIDYQGGRQGPLQYDPVSLLFQAKATLPQDIREKLLETYLDELCGTAGIDRVEFMKYYDGFILLRLLQVLGAYGFRGLIQKKNHFITSIPYALDLVRWFLANHSLPVRIDELLGALDRVVKLEQFARPVAGNSRQLSVRIRSFSYRNGIPEDFSPHGGGFVFDCRALPNPGRNESMRAFTGRDRIISDYLDASSEVNQFLGNVFNLVGKAVENYAQRGFSDLSVSFGCTGGQHRSVYCAEKLATFLAERFPLVNIILEHRELSYENERSS